jgi:hypothetical protein
MTDTPTNKGAPRGAGSFCIPLAALNALLDNNATAYEICTYLVLAKFTDHSGRFSTANISAVNRYTGANKTKGGPADRAIERLKTIRAKGKQVVSNGRGGKSHAMVDQVTDRGPILYDREAWLKETGEIPPDGPVERSKVLNVLPDFDGQDEGVWFGNALVDGYNKFKLPLKVLKNAGDVAARLLLSMYAANDMETWGGVRPIGSNSGPWKYYEPVANDVNIHGGARLIRAKDGGKVGSIDKRIIGAGDQQAYWDALAALESAGLIYEVVLVLNRNAIKSEFQSGEEFSNIPKDAEPLYELDCRSHHGYKPKGEEGIGGVTANTAGALKYPVTEEGGYLNGTYAAFVPKGFPAMIAGIYRLRFRVSNPKNSGVKGAWAGIHQRNKDALEFVNSIRVVHKIPPAEPPNSNPDNQLKKNQTTRDEDPSGFHYLH